MKVEIIAPSRLHFGLLSFGQPATRQFGGAGVAINEPGLRLEVSPSDRFECAGPLSERAVAVAERYRRLLELAVLPACRVRILQAPEEHLGLGTGTQLALAVVAGLNAFRGGEDLMPTVLAALAGRGARSAIGTYAFAGGGLLVELGKLDDQLLAPLEKRVELPTAWRFVLIHPHARRGLSGDNEQIAFDELPPVARSTTAGLLDELSELFAAAAGGEFDRFGESLYRYGHAAGMCFAPKQGGPFASPRIAELVAAARALGVRGVGQSSWGPTIFALVADDQAADEFRARIHDKLDPRDTITVTTINNSGAQIIRHNLP